MPDARYSIQSVQRREGDRFTGVFLGTTASIEAAFSAVGEAIQKDQGPGGAELALCHS